jgi:hypothetical protein
MVKQGVEAVTRKRIGCSEPVIAIPIIFLPGQTLSNAFQIFDRARSSNSYRFVEKIDVKVFAGF